MRAGRFFCFSLLILVSRMGPILYISRILWAVPGFFLWFNIFFAFTHKKNNNKTRKLMPQFSQHDTETPKYEIGSANPANLRVLSNNRATFSKELATSLVLHGNSDKQRTNPQEHSLVLQIELVHL